MTTSDFRGAEELHDQRIVEDLLTESGMDHPVHAGQLKPALMHVRRIAHGQQPTPRGEFAALLASLNTGPTTAPGTGTVSSLENRRGIRHARLVIAATALCLTAGAGAVAAAVNPDIRDTVTTLVDTLTSAPNDRLPGIPEPVDTPAPAVPVPGQPALPGKAVPGGAPVTPPAVSDQQRGEPVPGPQTNLGLHGSPATEHRAAPVIPRAGVPAQPPELPTTSTPPRHTGAIPEPPPTAHGNGTYK
ncbi:hypothetical protein GCM10027405_02570 [Arthrobacter alkaliphilus]|uniref:hypothetical protein n=1 Tax=Arthrobacter alkaliphilus TaxID=369936 RepID=UPI001F21B5C3|nr:hypothetical protein [Arthrobacter alkaliphilus]